MTRRMRAMLQDAGSIMTLDPTPDAYQRLIPKDTTSDRLGAVWARVGEHIRVATVKVRSESSETPKAVN